MKISWSTCIRINACALALSMLVFVTYPSPTQASSATLNKEPYSYTGGKTKDVSNNIFTPPGAPGMVPHNQHPSSSNLLSGAASSSSLASTSYYEPRGDYGGGYSGGGGGWGNGGGGHSVYQYSLQPQPYYHPAPMYYDDGGYEGMEKGLLGLLGLGGLTGLKGLLGLLGLAKLLLPLLGLLLPLLLPLLLLKAAALLALILLIPVPVISTGTAGRRIKIPTSIEEGKTYLKDTITDLLMKVPTDINHIISKIKSSSSPKETAKELKRTKKIQTKSNTETAGSESR